MWASWPSTPSTSGRFGWSSSRSTETDLLVARRTIAVPSRRRPAGVCGTLRTEPEQRQARWHEVTTCERSVGPGAGTQIPAQERCASVPPCSACQTPWTLAKIALWGSRSSCSMTATGAPSSWALATSTCDPAGHTSLPR